MRRKPTPDQIVHAADVVVDLLDVIARHQTPEGNLEYWRMIRRLAGERIQRLRAQHPELPS